jgi:uncharacterized protein YndB with AHSA1/START domain
MFRCVLSLILLVLGSALGQNVGATEETRAVYEAVVEASVEDVWQAFTTPKMLEQWMAPLVDIDLTVGGKLRSNYNPEGTLADAGAIENTILSYDPGRMLSLKATKFPEGFPFVEAASKTWSVFYFDELSKAQTKITIVGLGYSNTEESVKLREFFAVGNHELIEKLKGILQQQNTQPEGE